uniref:EF-hand domain-containing protein n=1 Tax=Panagrellus redivivus TaxID=6233 RepID=A0A7E4UQP0_PANRE
MIVAPPPNRGGAPQAAQPPPDGEQPAAQEQQQHGEQQQQADQKPLYQFAYSKYLETVVKILESEPKFTEKLRNMKEEDIKAGNIADHIDDLHESVFDELTKAKLAEIDRLREEIGKQIEKDGDAKNIHVPDHLDVQNWEKFNKEDLRKLVVRTVSDMEEIDKRRREEFKEYELRKKAEEDHKRAQLDAEERRKYDAELKAKEERHNDHEKLKHPGGREQLEEVWEESDHMDKDNFDPRTFFALHDLNGDGFWNDDEIEALFQVEIEKVYNETDPDDDPKERIEEMYRMREHVIAQMDKNKDRLIALEEFLQDNEATQPNEEKKDEGWDDIAHQKLYTEEELKAFEAEYAKQQGGQQAQAGNPPPPPPPVAQQVPVQPQVPQQAQQAPPAHQVPPAQPPQQQQQQQPPQQPPQQQQQVPVQAAPQAQAVPQAQAPPQPQVPVNADKKPVDPGYGI